MEKLLKYKVSLPGIKGFARFYLLKPATSLYSFHKLMRADMDFPQDQTVVFKAVDALGEAMARFSDIKNLGKGTIDRVSAALCRKEGWDHFVYFYDTINRKSVLVDFVEETVGEEGVYPMQLEAEAKGPNPIEFERGYVAMEDMPDDKRRRLLKGDEDDDEDVDEDDEEMDDDEEEIASEEEEFDEDEM